MKRWTFFVICLISLLLLKSVYAQQDAIAADISGRVGIGLYGGGHIPADTKFSEEDVNFEDVFLMGGAVIKGINRWLALELGAGKIETEMKVGAEGYKVTKMPLTLTVQLRHVGNRPEAHGNRAVYLLGGIGYYSTDIYQRGGGDTAVSIEDAFGFHAGGGIETFGTRDGALYIEVRWSWVEADMRRDQKAYSIDLDSGKVKVGLRLFF